MESFSASLKRELTHDEKLMMREQTKANVFEDIEADYNRVRLHSSLGYLRSLLLELGRMCFAFFRHRCFS